MKRINAPFLPVLFSLLLFLPWGICTAKEKKNAKAAYRIVKTDDFQITGDGNNSQWEKAAWLPLVQRRPAQADDTRATEMKAMYSSTGIYFFFLCKDKKLTATMSADFMDLWKEDVVEVFLWPDEKIPFYFEYEISPLDFELPLLISNQDMELLRWQPFYYEENRKTRHATMVQGGEKKSHAAIDSWTAEFFIPYKLLSPLKNVPPQKGTKWRANFYRNDYDDDRYTWSWQPTEKSYHEYEKFGTIVFE